MASYLISMVFEDFQPESPGVNVLARERPCLEHVQQSSMQVGQPLAHVLSLVFHWRQFKLSGVELSWFFWIVVFLSVWVIYTTSA